MQSSGPNQPPWAWLGSDQPTSLPHLFNTMTLNDLGNSGWVMDTGATDHVHTNRGILNSVSNNHYSPRAIYVGNGSAILVVTSGHSIFPVLNIYRTLHLQNVLITPNIIKNLIFVRNFTTHNKFSVDFPVISNIY